MFPKKAYLSYIGHFFGAFSAVLGPFSGTFLKDPIGKSRSRLEDSIPRERLLYSVGGVRRLL